MNQAGTLYVVAVPIGNEKDITLRAIETLRAVDAVVCEEFREGRRLLKKLEIEKELISLNEHNEETATPEIVGKLVEGKNLALTSDAGTPVFSDPGHSLIRAAVERGVHVVPIPGPASLITALSLCDFKIERFIFEGFLPRNKDERRQKLRQLRQARMPVVLMDAPYRLGELAAEVAETFGRGQEVILATDLTLPSEKIYRGPADAVAKQAGGRKAEFVLIIK
jgi:16S rRNA (cytidine1402-2'-O)-methyltransferase